MTPRAGGAEGMDKGRGGGGGGLNKKGGGTSLETFSIGSRQKNAKIPYLQVEIWGNGIA